MFTKLSNWVTAHPKKIIAFWIIVLLAGGYFAVSLPGSLSAGGFNDPDSESMKAKSFLQEEFSNKYPQSLIMVVDHPSFQVDSPEYEAVVQQVKDKVSDFKYVKDVSTYYDNKSEQYLSEDGLTTYLAIGLSSTEDQATNMVPAMEAAMEPFNTEGFSLELTGGPALTYALNIETKKEVTKAEMIAIPIMIVILLLVFRSVASALLPLGMALFALGSTMAFTYFIGQQITLNILITNIISMIGLGVVVDYALFIVSRFRKELISHPIEESIRRTIETSGRAVFYSGLTVAISLSALFIPNMMIFNSIALGGVVVVGFSIMVSLTLLPAILFLMGEKVNWGRLPFFKEKKKETNNKWEKLARNLMKRPVLFILPALAFLLFFTWPALSTNMQVPVASSTVIPEGTAARDGFELLTDKFSQGNIFPVEVIVSSKEGSMFDLENLKGIEMLSEELEKLKSADKVTSITNWNEGWSMNEYAAAYQNYEALPADVTGPLSGILNADRNQKTSVILVSSSEPADSTYAHELVRDIREKIESLNLSNFTIMVGGETAVGVDFDDRVFKNIPLIILSVFAISFLILVVTFKSILIPVKAIALNALVTVASVGVLVLVFQNELSLVSNSQQTINSITPVVLFAVLFGLSMDYEVIIISRMKELYDSGLSHEDSISKGISETAGIVNGAAAIMITVFGAFALVKIRVVAELGLGLAFSIIVDALIIRTIFVPILMKLMGRANWWLPFRKKSPAIRLQSPRLKQEGAK